jgi:flagellar hook-associated protein 1 FlgK
MTDLYGILNMGVSSLRAQQRCIDVTGNNIANINTPGYSRQRVNMEASEPISSSPGQLGTGVRSAEIQRFYDRFLGVQINNENQTLGKWEAQKEALEKVEILFDESSGYGLNQTMGAFWNAWQDLANNPSGFVERAELLSKSETMTNMFNQKASGLQQLQRDLDKKIRGAVDEINGLVDQIADINEKISKVEVSGQNANSYRDQRDLLLKDLSSLIDINSFENESGQVNLLTGNGTPLLQSTNTWKLTTEINGDGLYNVVWQDGAGNTTDITGDISGGQLKGWIDARDSDISGYLSRLDELSQNIVTQVNLLHQNGFDLNGNSGEVFFTGTSAFNMDVNQNISDNVNLVAAAENSGGASGDNGNALQIAGLQNTLVMSGGTSTFDEFYNSVVSDVGNKVKTVSGNYNHQSSMVTHLDNYRETVSGVSLDEEMINLIKFQHAYEAAARLISTVDEMLSALLNM